MTREIKEADRKIFWLAICLVFIVGTSLLRTSPTNGQARRGATERIKVHGKALEGNLSGDAPERDVSIYLPPSYKTAKNRRCPVVYFLHGFTDSDDKWFGSTNSAQREMLKTVEAIKTDEEVSKQSSGVLAMLASAAAWSPNPKNPPFFIDLPFRDSEVLPDILARQQAMRRWSLCINTFRI